MALKYVELVPDRVDIGWDGTCNIAGVAPTGDELQRDPFSSAADPERGCPFSRLSAR